MIATALILILACAVSLIHTIAHLVGYTDYASSLSEALFEKVAGVTGLILVLVLLIMFLGVYAHLLVQVNAFS